MSIPIAPPPVQAKASNQAITALILGIAGILTVWCCGFGIVVSPFAWFLGHKELQMIASGQSPATGQGIAQAGKILGLIGTILGILMLVWVLFAGGLAFFQAMAANVGK
ncbi:MAG TPA: hypothetical protein VN851_23530 [Thermoanaerobaculia bacterium]|nr:hypothetical protein [Thermoanaerobaculia bacterium]